MPPLRTVLFLCTGNFYRSRTAEILFQQATRKMNLNWVAASAGLALERGTKNIGPIAIEAQSYLQKAGIQGIPELKRFPCACTIEQLHASAWIVAMRESEHRPLLAERFPEFVEKVEYWHVEDRPGVLPEVEKEVSDLIARLMRGGLPRMPGKRPVEPVSDPGNAPKPGRKLTAKVGRETAGRRGKGVTTIFELPLSEDELKELATKLKNLCGTGGTTKDGRIEIQGDHRDKILEHLQTLGYQVKRVGG